VSAANQLLQNTAPDHPGGAKQNNLHLHSPPNQMIGGRKKDRNKRHAVPPRGSEDESMPRKKHRLFFMPVNCTTSYTFKSCNRL
jgi:hypothetical protein